MTFDIYFIERQEVPKKSLSTLPVDCNEMMFVRTFNNIINTIFSIFHPLIVTVLQLKVQCNNPAMLSIRLQPFILIE